MSRLGSPPILEELKVWLWTQAEITSLSIGKAAAYTLGIWERLTRVVDDVRMAFDNNATERAILGPVVARKNHYGSRSRRGTEVASHLYTIRETCKLHAVDPAAYLHDAVLSGSRRGPGDLELRRVVTTGHREALRIRTRSIQVTSNAWCARSGEPSRLADPEPCAH
jgi:hypothetical protein